MSAVEDKIVRLYAFKILSGDLDIDDVPLPYKHRVKEQCYVMSIATETARNSK